MTTFTVQTVHGIEETFVISPEGKVDKTAAYRNQPASEQRRRETERDGQMRPNDQSGSLR